MKHSISDYGYELYQRKIRLREGIDEDLQPYDIELPEPPAYKHFIGYGLNKKKQFFQYETIPVWVGKLNKLPREEAIMIAQSNAEYSAWIATQWEKRRNGVFMYIHGKPLFIPGQYWFYLNYCPLEGGNPDFRSPDLEEAYWRVFVVLKDPTVFGGIVIAPRRDGKSATGGNVLMEPATRVQKYVGGVLSKNGNDAETFFEKNVVNAWRRLPFYFSPKFDNKTYPKRELILRSPSKGGSNLDRTDLISEWNEEDLNSRIEARTTKETAFDGERLGGVTYEDCEFGLVIDEAAKWDEVDIYNTVMIHKECCRIRLVKVGKIYITTTIEQAIPKGLIRFKKLCDESSRIPERKMVNNIGATKSGFVIFFKPGWETRIYDKWGFPITETPTKAQSEYLKELWRQQGLQVYVDNGYHLLGARKLLEMEYAEIEDAADRQAYISRYPPSLKVAFTSVNKLCPFRSIDIIQKRLSQFRHGNPYVDKFDIEVDYDSADEIKPRKIVWTAAGKFEAPRELIEFWMANRANNVRINDQNFLIPENTSFGIIASDPFKYNQTEGSRKSMGTFTAFFNYDALLDGKKTTTDDWLTEDWGIHYCNRTATVDEYCEDAINLCHLLGMKMMCENNVDNVRQYFYRNGYAKFLEFRTVITEKSGIVIAKKAAQPGVQTTGGAEAEAVMGAVDSHLSKHGMRCKFPKILEDCRDLDPDDWSDYDNFVSAGRSCYYSKMLVRAKRQESRAMKQITDKGATFMGRPHVYRK